LLALRRLGLHREVIESQALLDLADDWDDRGSLGYAEPTWIRAVGVLLHAATDLLDEHRIRLASAEIMPGSQGAIDLDLRTPGRRMLLSIPADPDAPVRYYGHDDAKRNTTKGVREVTRGLDWITEWLAGE
jgi:hypothetical protein